MLDILRWMVLYSLIIVQLLPIDMMTMMMKAIIGDWRRYASSLNATKEYERRLHGSIVYMIKRMLAASTEG